MGGGPLESNVSDLSAKNFMGPLLRVLGTLSLWTAGVEVAVEEVYPLILKIMGLSSLDEHGINKASGQPQIVKWIQWAEKNVRRKGQTQKVSHGSWALTEEGLAEAMRLAKVAGDVISEHSSTPIPSPEAPVIPLTTVKNEVETYYHPDPYIRKIAIESTPCFGFISPHGASVCTDCPLRVECRNRQIAQLSLLASTLREVPEVTEEDETPETTGGSTAEKATKGGASGKYSNIDWSNVDIIKNKAEAHCAECGETIAKDERCRWVEFLPDTDDDGLLFHLKCSGGE